MRISRREFIGGGLATAWAIDAAARPGTPATLIVGTNLEPTTLTSAITTAGPTSLISTKIFEGLISYDLQNRMVPQLAKSWDVSRDGLTFTFHLRPGVTWHGGKPFTSADVAFSLLEVWKKYHGRGRTTFANVISAETPSPLVVVFRLSKPAPYLLSALTAVESAVLPRHLYEGTDILANPHNNAPIGTGPFRFSKWLRGRQIELVRNPRYWDSPKPYLGGLIFRIMPDAIATSIALETGVIHVSNSVPLSELERLRKTSSLTVYSGIASYQSTMHHLEFNLQRPALRDVRVRQAIAHAIDRNFLARHVWHGEAVVADSPVPPGMTDFHADDLPRYPFDLRRATQLLDAAGLKPDSRGVRLRVTLDYTRQLANTQAASHMRGTLAKAGIALQLRGQDYGEYVNRIYTRRDFDISMTGSGAGPDPAIGVQRYYWSRNIQPGVAFSNGAHYVSQAADRLLEAAQVEMDPVKRRALYAEFQRIAMTDLPYLPLLSPRNVVVCNRQVTQLLTTPFVLNGNFAEAKLAANA